MVDAPRRGVTMEKVKSLLERRLWVIQRNHRVILRELEELRLRTKQLIELTEEIIKKEQEKTQKGTK